ncbi:MAG: N-acyl homoserine lactonase family protein [Solirubrobacterales bacterium]|nr:N-acyl homoserine lactonase family protein [Solirubrobacterales bacterium]HMT05826.1 N-acyl homoserine lactonase family protein [Solirubrobacterales bacterium]
MSNRTTDWQEGNRAEIKVTAIQTGTANCHTKQEIGPAEWGPTRRKIGIMMDKEWAGPLPIYAYLVEHPEGNFLVDTGDSAHNSEKDWLPKLNPFFQKEVQIRVAPEEEVGPQLTGLGVDAAKDLKAVVMTHMHHDHTGGLNHFPHTEILADPAGLKAARRKRGLIGAVPRTWPRWFDPKPFVYDAGPVGPFQRSASLTSDGAIRIVETPGHMEGHVCVIARGIDHTYILAGDLTYRERNLMDDAVDGVTYSVETSLASQRGIKAIGEAEPSILLPAHDPDAVARLEAGRTMNASAEVSLEAPVNGMPVAAVAK